MSPLQSADPLRFSAGCGPASARGVVRLHSYLAGMPRLLRARSLRWRTAAHPRSCIGHAAMRRRRRRFLIH